MSKILSINKRWYVRLPYDSGCSGEYLTTVLVAGQIGDYAAYTGLGEDVEAIARNGDKISFEEALCHFPTIERGNYRD